MSSNYRRVQYFWLKLRTRFLLTNIHKRVCGMFFILFRSRVICKNQIDLVPINSLFTFLIISRVLNKIKKNLDHAFVNIVNQKTSAKFQQKTLNFMVIGARQSIQFFRQIHCVKSVRIRSYSGLHFPAFGLNTERYSISLRIQSQCGKMRTRITRNTDTFYAMNMSLFTSDF